MDIEKERIITAQWVLERNLAWIAAAEVKVGVVVAINTAMLGGLGASYGAVDKAAHTPWYSMGIVLHDHRFSYPWCGLVLRSNGRSSASHWPIKITSIFWSR